MPCVGSVGGGGRVRIIKGGIEEELALARGVNLPKPTAPLGSRPHLQRFFFKTLSFISFLVEATYFHLFSTSTVFIFFCTSLKLLCLCCQLV